MKRWFWFPMLVLLVCANRSAAEDLLRFDFSKVAASFPLEDRSKVEVAGAGLTVAIERPFARPQDRYVEALLRIAPDGAALKDVRVRVQLCNVADGKPASTLTVAPTAERARVLVDMRAARQSAMGLRIELLESSKVLAVAQALLRAQECDRPLQPAENVRIVLDVPEGIGSLSQWPVTFGVPFPAGALWDVGRLRVVDEKGREVPAQTEAVAHWAREGAIQWVRFDALVSLPGGCFMQALESARTAPESSEKVRLIEQGESVTVQVAQAQYVLGRGASPIREVSLDGRLVATAAGARGLYVASQDGRLATASAEGETMAVEARGPIAACVRFEGPYRTPEGVEPARHITRVEFFAGQPAAFITHTLVLTNDTNKVWFTDVGWELSAQPGDAAKALFGVSRTDWAKSFQHPLPPGRSASMLQDDHPQFYGGRKHFLVAEGSPARILLEGDEYGDWAAIQGNAGGLMVSCRDAARQHPKEFEVSSAKLNLELFSSRAGEQLDFRPPALVKRWNKGGKIPPALQEQILKQPSNAVGWAKTHQFFFRPVLSTATADEMARLARLHSTPVLALADPEWIHRARVFGPLHPRNTQRFPEAEKHIEDSFNYWYEATDKGGDYGFVDYFAGPHKGATASPVCPMHRHGYTLRHDIWLVYARSGDRRAHEFARNCTRTFMYHWERVTQPEHSTDTHLMPFLYDYYLNGYRRGRDAILDYAEGVKRWAADGLDCWREAMLVRALLHAYAATWDDELQLLLNNLMNQMYDPQGTVALSRDKRAYGSPTYKTQTDLINFIEAWQHFGTPRYGEIATKLSDFWWDRTLGESTTHRFHKGIAGAFLYDQTGNPGVLEGLSLAIRQAAGESRTASASRVAFRFRDLPCAMAVVTEAAAGQRSQASWVGADSFGFPVSVVAFRRGTEAVELRLHHTAGSLNPIEMLPLGDFFHVRPVGPYSPYGIRELRFTEEFWGVMRVFLPKDIDEGAYEAVPLREGAVFAMANGRHPLVVHAPKYFRPAPFKQKPFARVFFKAPEGARDAGIFFEGSAVLFEPDGRPFAEGKALKGWVAVPAGKPGLWCFQPVENWLVGVRNLPPFFAFGDPEHYFEPPIPWKAEPVRAAKKLPEDAPFAPGVSGKPADQALHLRGKRAFTLEAGAEHSSGDGRQFLPFQQGTIEFHIKPQWSTFDLWPNATKSLVTMPAADARWDLTYSVWPEREQSHSLRVTVPMSDGARDFGMTCLRRTVIERDQWMHVALVWGPREHVTAGRKSEQVSALRVFVNGKLGQCQHPIYLNARPKHAPNRLILGPQLDACIDNLRVSGIQRYVSEFSPSPHPMELDAHTRALFAFDGHLDGRSSAQAAKLPAQVIAE